jgi:two-component system chemotaxis response regulator CheY
MDRKELGVLVVDNEVIMQRLLIPMLENLGFCKFVTANNGKEAWRKLNDDTPIHLIISDLVMPKMNGIELLSKVRSSERFWELPFIMITSEENVSQLMSSIEVEVNAYILKPFTPIKLDEEISKVLKDTYNPSPYHLALKKGRTLLAQSENPAETLQAFQEACRIKPQEAEPYYFCAICHERMEHRTEAKACLEECIQLNEAYPKAYDLLALIYRREKDFAAERNILTRISALSPNNVNRNLHLALACTQVGDQLGVRKYLKVAARYNDPENLAIYERIFRVYLENEGMTAEAEVVYRKYIDKSFANPRLINKFALLFKAVKSYEQTIFFLERIVQIWRNVKNHGIPPEDMAIYYFNLAVAYIEQANTFSDQEQKRASYQTAEKLVSKAMDCDIHHQEALNLYRWLSDRLN